MAKTTYKNLFLASTMALKISTIYAMENQPIQDECAIKSYNELFETLKTRTIEDIQNKPEDLRKVVRSFSNENHPNLTDAVGILETVEKASQNTRPELTSDLTLTLIQQKNFDKAVAYLRKFASEKFTYYGATKYYYDISILQQFDLMLDHFPLTLSQKKDLLTMKKDYLTVLNFESEAFEINKELYLLYKEHEEFTEEKKELKKVLLRKANDIAGAEKSSLHPARNFLIWMLDNVYEKQGLDLSNSNDLMFIDWLIKTGSNDRLKAIFQNFFTQKNNTHPCYYGLIEERASQGSTTCLDFIQNNMQDFFKADSLENALLYFLQLREKYLQNSRSYNKIFNFSNIDIGRPFVAFVAYSLDSTYYFRVNNPQPSDKELIELANNYLPGNILLWDRINKAIANAEEEIACYKGLKWRMDLGRYQNYPLTEQSEEVQARRKFIESVKQKQPEYEKLILDNISSTEFTSLFNFYAKLKEAFPNQDYSNNPLENIQNHIKKKLTPSS